MSRIEVDTDFGVVTVTSGERLCLAMRPDAVYRAGCVHEHVREVPLCKECARSLETAGGNCRMCLFEVASPHECPVIARRVT